MELTYSINPTPTPSSTKTPDSEVDTPPLIKPVSFTNGNNHHSHHNQSPPCAAVIYKECLKNHAASIGGHAVDGCGEFMPSPESTPSDPISLKCAACGCHRNFHRREPSDDSSPPAHFIDFRRHIFPPIKRFSPSPTPSPSLSPSLSPPPLPSLFQPQPVTPTGFLKSENPNGRKRFRTKFTAEQKEKMHSFSEKLGWKLQKCDEAAVDEFCNEIGVGKGVLRVWMHNNKNTFGKKDYQISNNSSRDHSFENKNGFNINGTASSNEEEDQHRNNNNDNSTTSNCELHLHISTNGSSSSS